MGGKPFLQSALRGNIVGVLFAMFSFGAAQANNTTMAENAIIVPPWAPATNESTFDRAAYFTIRNVGDRTIRLIEVRTTGADIGSLGKTEIEIDGDLHGSAIFQVMVPPNELVTLEPGGQLVRLRDLTESLVAGTKFALHLTFSDGSLLSVDVPVRSVGELGTLS